MPLRALIQLSLTLACIAHPALAYAQKLPAPFTGTWTTDLRTPAQKKEQAECGKAIFKLIQTGAKLVGNHTFATPQCSRLNEGGEGSVKGVVVGDTAVLVVTSGRNGQIVMGSANVRAGALHWQVTEEIKPGEPEGDSGLILHKGVLRKEPP